MTTIKSSTIDSIYRQLFHLLIDEENIRENTYDLNEVVFELTDVENNIVNVRDISIPYLCGEMLWYMLGRNDIDFIHKFSSYWSRISDDGITCNSAYGDIIFKRHGFNQYDKVVELLKKYPNSRRAVINLNVPNENVIDTKDEICTISLTFYIRNNLLYCSTVMRSNDLYTGLPYDVAFFTSLQKMMANDLGVKCGSYYHHAVSLHVYEKDVNKLEKIINEPVKNIIKFDLNKLNMYKNMLGSLMDKDDDPKTHIYELCEALDIFDILEV